MERLPNVVIVLARCARERGNFGIRLEEVSRGTWVADWAFPVKERTARKEHYDRGEVRGNFSFAPAYPGCPCCRAISAFKCACGKLSCWDGVARVVHCPWCGNRGELGGTVDSLSTSGDR